MRSQEDYKRFNHVYQFCDYVSKSNEEKIQNVEMKLQEMSEIIKVNEPKIRKQFEENGEHVEYRGQQCCFNHQRQSRV